MHRRSIDWALASCGALLGVFVLGVLYYTQWPILTYLTSRSQIV
jgi:hypothetical protein